MDMAVLSLIFLVACIIIGFVLKRNLGFIAIALALILGRIAGVSDAEIIAGFNTNLFVILLGVTYLFTIAMSNGTLEAIVRHIVALAGRRVYLIPLIFFILGAIMAMAGPGTIPTLALTTILSTAIAKELDIDPLPFTLGCFMGAAGGGMSPLASTGIVALNLAEKEGYTGIGIPYMFTVLVAFALFGLAYYFVTGLFKLRADTVPESILHQEKITRPQWITIGGMAVMLILVIFFKVNVGLASFLVAAILNIIGVCEERKVFAEISWSTLIMVCGVSVLMNLVIVLGGIDKLSGWLVSIMTPFTAPALMSLSAGCFGFFASTIGVVIPTLVPAVPDIAAGLGGAVDPFSLFSALSVGSQISGISPASTGGALVLAAYVTLYKPNSDQKNRYFIRLFITSIIGVLFVSALGLVGFYSWFI